MSRPLSQQQQQQLESIYQLRERRALRALQSQRQVLAQASGAHQRQRAQVDGVLLELRGLDAQRQAGAQGLSADALRLAADRRRCLQEDLEHERGQLEIARQQLQQEQRALDDCRTAWQRQGEHLSALDELAAKGKSFERRRANRRNEDVLDDFSATADKEGLYG